MTVPAMETTGPPARFHVPVPQIPFPNSGNAASPQLSKLRQAAGQFESMLLESLWKSMKDTFTDPDDSDADPTLNSYEEWSMQAMASAVGSTGSLGIKNLILKYLEPTLETGSAGRTPR